MNLWTLLIGIAIVAAVYLFLTADEPLSSVVRDDEYCAQYDARVAQNEFSLTYDERVEAVAHGCLE